MVELLTKYTLGEIAIVVVMVLLAIKEAINLYKFFFGEFKGKVKKEDRIDKLEGKINILTEAIHQLSEKQNETQEQMQSLVQSEVQDIKSWIVEKYNYYKLYPEKLDNFTMDCLERRFESYEKMGGNTYIHDLMDELRAFYHNK